MHEEKQKINFDQESQIRAFLYDIIDRVCDNDDKEPEICWIENEMENNFENNDEEPDVYNSDNKVFDTIINTFITPKTNYRRNAIIARQNY